MRDVEQGLADGVIAWIVLGDAPLLVDRAVQRLVAWGQERCGPPQFNLSRVHASEANAVAALNTARTLPMMAAMRVVVVRELEQADDTFWGALVGYLAEPSPSTLLVCSGAGFPKVRKGGVSWPSRVQKAATGRARIVKLGAADVVPAVFAREHARSVGKELSEADARLLIEVVGAELGRVSQEVEKLALYVGDSPRIVAADIHAASSLLAEAVVWELTSGIAARQPKRAVAALHRMLEDGEPEHRLLALVVWQLRQVMQVARLAASGADAWEISRQLKMRADNVRDVMAALPKQPLDAARMLERLAAANRAMNSHRAGTRKVLEALVLDLCR